MPEETVLTQFKLFLKEQFDLHCLPFNQYTANGLSCSDFRTNATIVSKSSVALDNSTG